MYIARALHPLASKYSEKSPAIETQKYFYCRYISAPHIGSIPAFIMQIIGLPIMYLSHFVMRTADIAHAADPQTNMAVALSVENS